MAQTAHVTTLDRPRRAEPVRRRAAREGRPIGRPWALLAFPGARLARIADAPPRCPSCGGPWRRLQASVACLTCPTELYAAAELDRVETGAAD